MKVEHWVRWISRGLLLGALVFSTAQAQDNLDNSLSFNVFSLSASASGEAANDLMRVTVVAQDEGEDSAELQSSVNASMQWAISRLRPYTQIDVKTQDYKTFPQYNKNRTNIVGWRASQSLNLETTDVKSAGEAIRKLQERLQVTNIRFEPTPSTRSAVEDQLINEALDAFKQRAQLIRSNIGAPGYNLLDINVQTGASFAQPQLRGEIAMIRSDSVAKPALEAGSSQITVTVTGRIQLGDVQ